MDTGGKRGVTGLENEPLAWTQGDRQLQDRQLQERGCKTDTDYLMCLNL